jgi:hypothetical protein
MQIRKAYKGISPDLLFAEVRDFSLKQGLSQGENKMETYTVPDQSADFVTRATLTFNSKEKECLRVHMVGTPRGETKLMIDVDEKLFPAEKLAALQTDLDFIFGSFEAK